MASKKSVVGLNNRKIESLRMLMDWQIREMGYDVAEVNRALQRIDDAAEASRSFRPIEDHPAYCYPIKG